MVMDFIRNFNQIGKGDASIAGGKGASLGEMTRAGIPVPPGFVVLATAFERFLEETDLNVEIDAILDVVNHKEIHTVEDASEKIQALILQAEMPKDIATEIKKYFKNLNAKFVAVRSSATAEDSSTAAWAGQLESYLNTTEKNLLQNIQKCWASLFTPRAIFYRFEKELHKQKISVAVVVQKMVESEASGIAFSVHPVTQDYNQLIIEAGFGLGEAIVSGQITPDSYVVEKQPRRIIDKNVEIQSKGLYRAKSGGNEWLDITKEKGEKQVLSDTEILELSEIVLRIENHYGFPSDIEWAFEKGKFYIVQSRPITTLGQNGGTKRKFTKEHSREYSLFRVATWYMAMNQELPQIIGASVKEACAVYRGENLVEIYYEPAELKKLLEAVTQSSKDKYEMSEKIEGFLSKFEELKKYFTGEKYIKNIDELKEFQDEYALIWAYIGVVFMIPVLPVDEELKKLAYKVRSQIQEYNEAPEVIFNKFMEATFPKIKNGVKFVLPDEIWSGEIKSKDIFSKIIERKKGFIFYKNKILTGNLTQNLDKLGILLEEKESVISGRVEATENEIKGQIACKGRTRGAAKIVSSTKDLSKVKEGDILVAAMTMPKYLPAMKKAAAFITDEGGLTSHAAIVSREMNKPCIIGTKIATKVLKDGDFVEVDASDGVIKILQRQAAGETTQKPQPIVQKDINLQEWQFEFRQRDAHPVLMADLWCRALYSNFEDEIKLPVKYNDYLFTSSQSGYVKSAQKQKILSALQGTIQDEQYLKYIVETTEKRANEWVDFANKVSARVEKEKLSNEDFSKLWNEFDVVLSRLIPWFYIPWYITEENMIADQVRKGLERHRKLIEKQTDFNNALMVLIFPTQEALFQKEQHDFFKLIGIAREKKNFARDKSFIKEAEQYIARYSWMKTFLLLPIEPLSFEELVDRVKNALRDKSYEEYQLQIKQKAKNTKLANALLKSLQQDESLARSIEWARKFAWLLAASVEQALVAGAKLIPFYKLLAKQIGAPYRDWVHLTSEEIAETLKGKAETLIDQIKERKTGFVFAIENGVRKLSVGEDGKRLSEWIDNNVEQVDLGIEEIKGQPATPGSVEGPVRIALRASDSHNLQNGEILVCSMTSPDYVPAMKKAAAIITDEGGLLSHAAIISRELGKPCIVGVKIATKVLKDGDLVEVDATKGVIQKSVSRTPFFRQCFGEFFSPFLLSR
jgi:phosphoenolpyruvate synthase/pyruvate phosphate dikinase